ncbi:hypothetical protein BKA67DRAFT_608929 [Truncatella angustata]|uniref:Meiotically up-regulated gene 190 protein n=1 Tax=Truncatella angustata TaxID=152316 RepID=A0A9P8UEG5_9PEZI|nr:uncharacterized protein BKA67DRAFT_608929 [Truncatella angustata]KAH6648415.1 hypothetical protein BKA67DRAFT_608929 [Truncatella angustata]KAH8204851.1 hypothetical protein TruAng_001040 [Truncatella angustata]
MPSHNDFEDDAARRSYVGPHSGKHPIPTIQGYRERRKELDSDNELAENLQHEPADDSKPKRAFDSVKAIFNDQDSPKSHHDPYPATNRNYAVPPGEEGRSVGPANSQVEAQQASQSDLQQDEPDSQRKPKGSGDGKKQEKTATEAAASAVDPKEKRKVMKKTKRHGGGREVTDPVTHLPIIIHDQTDKDLNAAPENEAEPGTDHFTATGPQGAAKSRDELDEEQLRLQRGFNGTRKLFPPPDLEDLQKELASVYQQAVYWGFVFVGVATALVFIIPSLWGRWYPQLSTLIGLLCFALLVAATAYGMGQWINTKVNAVFEDETWDAARAEEEELDPETVLPESVQWLNRLLASIWPLVNPDLFSSLIDMIEDVMQASLPKVIKMVSVDDMGQGNESIRILGVRWLPTGAASKTVSSGGKLEGPNKKSQSDRTDAQNEQEQDENDRTDKGASKEGDEKNEQEDQDQVAIREGMEAEEGDFINLELAFSYRARSSGKSITQKAKSAHMMLKFYLPGGIAVPVWVELRGIVGTMRLRLQLTPDPPFISLCTITFLGQPKASMACIPLSKHSLNVMDVPLISSFVQSAIDAALAEYVAPKSLTLNLKDMLVGDDFKKDTISKGVVLIFIKRARGFKQGDGGIGPMQGASDAYVTVSWGKFGKPVASTRIIMDDQSPDWNEYATILVSPEELNAEEKLRLQLWDSDRWTADDDLGRVELDLKSLIHNPESHNKIQKREDRFTGQDPDEEMAGSLTWSVGYFTKTRIQQYQLEQQTVDDTIRTKEQLRDHVSQLSEHKLREADKSSDDDELHQQKAQDYRELEDAMIISAPPSDEFPSGILSVQIHNITSLEVQKLRKQDKHNEGKEDQEDESERDDDMPDSYCTIILNHKKTYKTRTKPKNSKPFFNAGMERFIRDWRTTEVIVSVRDAREREDDPLIGMVYLPLAKVFEHRTQIMESYPLVGGIGYGRARISMVWRSVEMKLPQHLRGWDYGTLEVRGAITAKSGLPDEILKHRIKIRTNVGKTKFYGEGGRWMVKGKDESESAFLAVRKRYSSPLVIEFRKSALGPDSTIAFAVLWLQELVDEEDEVHIMKVWKGGKDQLKKAESCYGYTGLEEGEQPLGELEIPLKFWRGLSGFHKGYAAKVKNGDMRQVMECLDTISDENLKEDGEFDDTDDDSDSFDERCDSQAKKKLKVHTNDDSSDSSSDDDKGHSNSSSNVSISGFKKVKNILRNPVEGTIDTATSVLAPGHVDSNDGSRGLRNQMRDYKDHHKQLHRKHHGIMQWRVARQADHMGGKMSRLKGKIENAFSHTEKDTGVETEV